MKENLTKKVIYTYTLGIFTLDMLNAMNTTYWAYFMTDVALIGATTVGTILLVSRIFDYASVPILGIVMEKTNLRWGKYRSWLLVAPPFLVIFFFAMFSNPSLGSGVKAVYLGFVYVLASIFLNLCIGTRNTLVSVLGKSQEERVILAAKKAQGGTAGKILFGLISLPLILAVNGGQKAGALGFQVTVIFFGIFVLISCWALFILMPKEDGSQDSNSRIETEKISLKEMMGLFFKNGAYFSLIIVEGTRYVAQFLIMGLAMYYFQYVFKNLHLFAVLLTTINIVAFGGTIVIEFITKKFDKRTVYFCGLIILILAHLINYLFAKNAITFIVIISIGYFGAAMMNGTSLALCSDAALYGQWKTGLNAKGFLMSMTNFCPKIGLVVNSAVIGFGLSSIGYKAGGQITPEMAAGMNILINLVPAGFLILGGSIMFFLNKLSIAEMEELQRTFESGSIPQYPH